MSFCVYKHTNKINGKVYIGQTCNIKDRWSRQGDRYRGAQRSTRGLHFCYIGGE